MKVCENVILLKSSRSKNLNIRRSKKARTWVWSLYSSVINQSIEDFREVSEIALRYRVAKVQIIRIIIETVQVTGGLLADALAKAYVDT
jgi:hypothetical protein